MKKKNWMRGKRISKADRISEAFNDIRDSTIEVLIKENERLRMDLEISQSRTGTTSPTTQDPFYTFPDRIGTTFSGNRHATTTTATTDYTEALATLTSENRANMGDMRDAMDFTFSA